ncbi:MAG: glycosyltransferase [Kiritimatiellae bacterium]|nr:glycosyltransferase [Kiritimatiellia bacterium]MDW8458912.1 glycosyltransferase [Verrucomicrobiota bacterium]
MSVPAIHQILNGFADGDAISNCARVLRDLARRRGAASEIFAPAAHVAPAVRGECRPLEEYQGRAGDLVLHHYSIASPAVERFLESPASRVLVYHNITPAEFFRGFDDAVAAQLARARERLPDVVRRADACWAVSEFNAAELRASGARDPAVFPLVFDPTPLDVPDDPDVRIRFRRRLTTFLTVGRIAPNKRLEVLIEAFNWYHKTLDPFSRLVIVGSDRSCPRYFAMLRMLAGDFDLPNVCFEGFASPRGLPTYYRCADVYVSTSDHEGYCLPLLEAMYCGVPVVAHAIGGMPEAMGGAGVLYEGLTTAELAVLLHKIANDRAVRREVLASQQRRIDQVRARNLEAEFDALLARVPRR